MIKTAYEVCEKVCELARRENRILNMGDWKFSSSIVEAMDRKFKPACGTVCCLSGWVSTITQDPAQWSASNGDSILLPHGDDGKLRLDLYHKVFLSLDRVESLTVGTPEYVEAALKPFLAFMKKHKRLLESTEITIHPDAEKWWRDSVAL